MTSGYLERSESSALLIVLVPSSQLRKLILEVSYLRAICDSFVLTKYGSCFLSRWMKTTSILLYIIPETDLNV